MKKINISWVLYAAYAIAFILGLILKNRYLMAGGFLLAAIYWLIYYVKTKKN